MGLLGLVLLLAAGIACSTTGSDGPASRGGAPGANLTGNASPGPGAGEGQSTAINAGNTTGTAPPIQSTTMDPGNPSGPPLQDSMAVTFARDDSDGAGLDPGTLDRLRAGGGNCTAPLIYPYDRTVFPGGLPAPTLMWNGATDAVLVHMGYDMLDSVDYTFAAGASNPGEVTIPQQAWSEITRRSRNTVLRVTVNALVNGAVSTCEATWKVAMGEMIGSIYYNTYNAPGVNVAGNGAVMRLTLGNTNSEIYLQYVDANPPAQAVQGPCIACHSVSFNGSTIVASTHYYAPGVQTFDVFSYPLQQTTQPAPVQALPNTNFGALTPDGTRMLAMGNPTCTAGSDSFPRSPNNFPLVEGPDRARVLDTATGAVMDAPGLNPDFYMWMPQFSPNGDMVVFNHAKPDGAGGTDRRQLATMKYDQATNTFSDLQVIVDRLGPDPSLPYQPAGAGPLPLPLATGNNGCTDVMPALEDAYGWLDPGTCTGPCYPAHPFFTPDGKAVIFSLVSEPDFASAFPGRSQPAKGELWYVDLEAKKPLRLDNINTTIDPADAQHEYYPTVLPVPVGGYFWVFWTSRRAYGHRNTHLDQNVSAEEDPFKKRIWAAAILPRSTANVELANEITDPSSPGFYLEGQSESGNVRGFAALSPCKTVGPESTCTAGLDCCTGFCYIEEGATIGACTEDVPACSKTNERCESDSDCCPPEGPDIPVNTCIGGFCSFIVAPL